MSRGACFTDSPTDTDTDLHVQVISGKASDVTMCSNNILKVFLFKKLPKLHH